jgi:hypothetical protein
LGDEHVGVGVEVVERVDTVRGGAEGRDGEDGDTAGLDGADNERLVGSEEVGVDDTEATKGHHNGGHGALSDSVHRNLVREAHGGGDCVVISFLTVHLPTFTFIVADEPVHQLPLERFRFFIPNQFSLPPALCVLSSPHFHRRR